MHSTALATDSWSSVINGDSLMSEVNRRGLLHDFAEVTQTELAVESPFLKRFSHRGNEELHHMYMDKCNELYEKFGDKEEKILSGPPLGRLVQCGDMVFGENVVDDSPLIKHRDTEDRMEEISKLQRRKKDLELGVIPKNDTTDKEDMEHELGETYDRLEFATRKYWKLLLFIKTEEINRLRFNILLASVIEFVVSISLFGVGSQQLDGGRTTVVIATYSASVVGILSSCLGFFGALPEAPNEYTLYLFYSAQVWLMALLTTFVFIELNFINDNNSKCTPSLASYAGDDACDNRAELYASLIIGFLKLLNVLFAAYTTSQLLDEANDQSSLTDKFLLFKYKLSLIRELQLPVVSYGDWNYHLRVKGPVQIDSEPVESEEQ
eukprot:TRINITY_DN10266_c0_g1_i2.p1 TRINITY_DN10266_c0_g1~~TRINITY_DN10266_c0_g1_i2.p1  ORF type:complete len:396 (+),score=55.22 TRINITY_DN10266_c0_g1_i2:51-1190(+)